MNEPNPKTQPFEAPADRSRRPPILELRYHDGDRLGLVYNYLTAIELRGTTKIILTFTKRSVTIEGENLGPLFAAFTELSVRYVTETPNVEARPYQTVIRRIDDELADFPPP